MIQDLIAAERRELAAVLDGLLPAEWATPTLCAGWRVPEVVAHLTMPFRMSTGRFARELLKSAGRFNHMADRVARRDAAELSPEALVTSLRDNAEHPWRPPGGGAEGALSHDVIHGLDITTALSLDRRGASGKARSDSQRSQAEAGEVLRCRSGGRLPACRRPRLVVRHRLAAHGRCPGSSAGAQQPAAALGAAARRAEFAVHHGLSSLRRLSIVDSRGVTFLCWPSASNTSTSIASRRRVSGTGLEVAMSPKVPNTRANTIA